MKDIIYFTKSFILDVWLGSKYDSVSLFWKSQPLKPAQIQYGIFQKTW